MQILPCHILPNLAKSYLVINYHAKSCQILFCHILPNVA